MMQAFKKMLAERQPDPQRRRWLFIPYDQLSDKIGPLSHEEPRELGIVLIENTWKAARRPYHKQKLALILANLRHFALEQAARGVAIRHIVTDGLYREALERLIAELGPMRVMMPAERELRVDLQPLVDAGGLELSVHEGWLNTHEQFLASQDGPPWRMDAFYRHIRKVTGMLMQNGKPVGGKFSMDTENRQPWKGHPPAPQPPTFPRDAIKEEVVVLIEKNFASHPGSLDPESLPATLDDAEKLCSWAKRECLHSFGPYEDAMSMHSSGLFHTRISSLLNLHRLLPARVVAEVAKMDLPLSSKEGFIRQVLGWREFVHHVHVATDGFRHLPAGDPPIAAKPGDAGYHRWAGEEWPAHFSAHDPEGGAMPATLGNATPLPPAYWGKRSGLNCLDHVVAKVWEEGWSHHITRLMVLANLATLLDVSPRELADWFWIAYTDAYDWVVEPNVLGMGTFAIGDLITTKPYVSGAAYIARMGDYCKTCAFDPKKNCPITNLYWAFQSRHQRILQKNPRLGMPMQSLRKRHRSQRRHDQAVFEAVRKKLTAGEVLKPENLPAPKV